MKDSVFNEDERFTDLAITLDDEATKLIDFLFRKYIQKGIKVREISHILILNALSTEMQHLL